MDAILRLAEMLKETARLHEESGIAKERTNLGNYKMNMPIQTAARKACGDTLWFPVYLLLSETWNDALDWANNPEAYEKEEVQGPKVTK